MTTTETTKQGQYVDPFPLRLNLGCGSQIAGGWINVDEKPGPGVFRLDMTKPEEWKEWGDGEVEGIVIHHVLSHFTAVELASVLDECRRVLKPGAWLRVSDADLARGVEAAIAGELDFFAQPKFRDGSTLDAEWTLGHFIVQGGWRKQWLTAEDFARACGRASFSSAYSSRFRQTRGPQWLADLDTRVGESWFAEAQR